MTSRRRRDLRKKKEALGFCWTKRLLAKGEGGQAILPLIVYAKRGFNEKEGRNKEEKREGVQLKKGSHMTGESSPRAEGRKKSMGEGEVRGKLQRARK